MLSIVRDHLDRKGVKYVLSGRRDGARKQMVDEFQDNEDVKVFLISLKAGGLGLNLDGGRVRVPAGPVVESGGGSSGDRPGAPRRSERRGRCFAYRLICSDTVEEKIPSCRVRKRELADAILEADGLSMQDLTADDLENCCHSMQPGRLRVQGLAPGGGEV